MEKINVTALVEHLIEKKRDDLSLRQLAVWMACRDGKQTVRGLAERLNLPQPAITRAADKLEELGFIVRAKDPSDGRSVLLSITADGRKFSRDFV